MCKSPEVNSIEDLTVYSLRSLAPVVIKARELGISTHSADVFICETVFATMTNVNFNPKRFREYLHQCLKPVFLVDYYIFASWDKKYKF